LEGIATILEEVDPAAAVRQIEVVDLVWKGLRQNMKNLFKLMALD